MFSCLVSSVLDTLVATVPSLQHSLSAVTASTPSVVRVMLYDLLFGKHKSMVGGGTLKRIILESETELRDALDNLKEERSAKTDDDLLPSRLRNTVVLPRYVRVNLLLTTVADAVAKFAKDGWTEVASETGIERLQTDASRKWTEKLFWRDPHLSDLLVFPPGADFHDDSWVTASKLVLQDKASALGGACLQPPADPATVALDGCSAPGQKTAQLAQHMQNMGTLLAIEQDNARYRTLMRLGRARGMKNMLAFNRSFLDIDPCSPPFSDVQYILLDPSCSGSGIVNRLDFSADAENDEVAGGEGDERLRSLSEFQFSVIQHAFTFPRLRRLVYSTCSVHDIENELVVERALEAAPNGWKLVPAAPDFPSRGKELFPGGSMCLRTVPESDRTIGFFAACFERDDSAFDPPADVAESQPQTAPSKKKRVAQIDAGGSELAPPSKRPKLATPAAPSATIPTSANPPTAAKSQKKKKKQKAPKPITK